MTFLYLTENFKRYAKDAGFVEHVSAKLQALIKPDSFDSDKLLTGYGNGFFVLSLGNDIHVICLLEKFDVDGQSVDFLFAIDVFINEHLGMFDDDWDTAMSQMRNNTYPVKLSKEEKEYAIRDYRLIRDTPYIYEINIRNFKQFEELSVKNIGQFNLVLGDNNTGKTSFLEALAFDDSPEPYIANLLYIKACREGMSGIKVMPRKLLRDFRNIHHEGVLSVAAKYGAIEREYVLKPGDNTVSLEKKDAGQPSVVSDLNNFSQFVTDFTLRMENNEPLAPEKRLYQTEIFEKNIFFPLIPFGKGYDTDLASYYSSNFKSLVLRKWLLEEMKAFIPQIAIIDVGGDGVDIYETGKDMPVSISQYGEGANKLFRILLQIMSAKGKRLMIDEIDAGIHRRRFPVFWKTILKAADKHGVQLFATTHNLECVEHFAKMLETEEMEGLRNRSRTITLYRTVKNEIKARVREYEAFDEDINGGYNIMGGE